MASTFLCPVNHSALSTADYSFPQRCWRGGLWNAPALQHILNTDRLPVLRSVVSQQRLMSKGGFWAVPAPLSQPALVNNLDCLTAYWTLLLLLSIFLAYFCHTSQGTFWEQGLQRCRLPTGTAPGLPISCRKHPADEQIQVEFIHSTACNQDISHPIACINRACNHGFKCFILHSADQGCWLWFDTWPGLCSCPWLSNSLPVFHPQCCPGLLRSFGRVWVLNPPALLFCVSR